MSFYQMDNNGFKWDIFLFSYAENIKTLLILKYICVVRETV